MKFKRLIAFLLLLFMTCGSVFAENKFAKVVLVGDLGCGKTAIWKRLMGEGFDPDELQSSDRLNGREITWTNGGDKITFKIWDTAGIDRRYEDVVDFTAGAHFVFIVHDLYRKLDESHRIYLSRIYRDVSARIAPGGKIVLVGSKRDKRHLDIVNSAAQARMLEEVAGHIPCAYVLTSAKDDGDPGMKTLIPYILENSRRMVLSKTRSPEGNVLRFHDPCKKCKKRYPLGHVWWRHGKGEAVYCSKECAEEDNKRYCKHGPCYKKFFPGTGVKGQNGEYCSEVCRHNAEDWCTIM